MSARPHEESESGFREASGFDRADRICDAYEREWLAGRKPSLADFLAMAPEVDRASLRRELELIEQDYKDRVVDPCAAANHRETDQDTDREFGAFWPGQDWRRRRRPVFTAFPDWSDRRHLSGQPIEAKRDSALYLFRKSLRRYKAAATVAVVLAFPPGSSLDPVAFSPDGRYVIAGAAENDGNVRVYENRTGALSKALSVPGNGGIASFA